MTRDDKKKQGFSIQTQDLDALRNFDTCTISNAVETFGIRLRNTGFADDTIRCIFGDLMPVRASRRWQVR
jgi:hypothetical protein